MRRHNVAAAFVALLAWGCAQPAKEPPHAHEHGVQHRFDDPEAWAKRFDDPERDGWQKPELLIGELGLGPSDVVADLGAGTGYFSVRLARAVPRGKVFAVDIEPKMVDHATRRARAAKLENVIGVVAAMDDAKLPEPVDLVLVVDTYHHLSHRSAYFARLAERLTAKGRVVVVDFKMGNIPVGPPDRHKIPPQETESEMKAAGFSLCRSFDGLPYQYVLFFARAC